MEKVDMYVYTENEGNTYHKKYFLHMQFFSMNEYMHIVLESHQNSEPLFLIKFAKYMINS